MIGRCDSVTVLEQPQNGGDLSAYSGAGAVELANALWAKSRHGCGVGAVWVTQEGVRPSLEAGTRGLAKGQTVLNSDSAVDCKL
jgi:hypothetical protein